MSFTGNIDESPQFRAANPSAHRMHVISPPPIVSRMIAPEAQGNTRAHKSGELCYRPPSILPVTVVISFPPLVVGPPIRARQPSPVRFRPNVQNTTRLIIFEEISTHPADSALNLTLVKSNPQKEAAPSLSKSQSMHCTPYGVLE